uniref:Uncharacterized protein n=1 Tax=Siphoviridae sp. ctAnS47 TaxID=2826183 RepID=A0A8S5QYT1_9CAUD|nr:MAG TPA: hypothetical protein [Siphoviridae sp. ctAnS47]
MELFCRTFFKEGITPNYVLFIEVICRFDG